MLQSKLLEDLRPPVQQAQVFQQLGLQHEGQAHGARGAVKGQGQVVGLARVGGGGVGVRDLTLGGLRGLALRGLVGGRAGHPHRQLSQLAQGLDLTLQHPPRQDLAGDFSGDEARGGGVGHKGTKREFKAVSCQGEAGRPRTRKPRPASAQTPFRWFAGVQKPSR